MPSTRKANVYGDFTVRFGIVNAAGLMETKLADYLDEQVMCPVFAHESYKISTTFDTDYAKDFGLIGYKDPKATSAYKGKSYLKIFRKSVMWDFGDGTQIEGYTAEHWYKIPGKYTITCTFFDIYRQGYKNAFSIEVIVKQPIPTQLAISDYSEAVKLDNVVCSAVNTVALIDATLSNLVTNEPGVIVERIFEPEDEVLPIWEDVKDLPNPHFQKYYSLLDGKWESDEDDPTLFVSKPTTVYHPEYYQIYGHFIPMGALMIMRAYRVNPFLEAYENTPEGESDFLSINSPNSSILDPLSEPKTNVTVRVVSSVNELPEGATPIGKRAMFTVNYKSDFISKKDVFTLHYDMEHTNVDGNLKSGVNFLNMAPLGMNFPVVANKFSTSANQRFFFSLSNTGFDHSTTGVSDDVALSLVKDFTYSCYLLPFIQPLVSSGTTLTKNVYIPKDYDFYKTDVSVRYLGKNDSKVTIDRRDDFNHVLDVKFELKNVLDVEIVIPGIQTIRIQKDLFDLEAIVVPTEKYYRQDLDELLAAYLPHKCFDDAINLKQMLKNAFGNNEILDYLVTKGVNFFDDHANIDTVYIKQLLAYLTMMGREVTEYNTTNFDGVNELRDIARILSMNYTKLMGNKILKKEDIRVNSNTKGENVGDKIEVDDILHAYMDNIGGELLQGKVFKLERTTRENGKDVTTTYNIEVPTVLIAADDYTEETKTVSFAGITPISTYYDSTLKATIGKYSIQHFLPSWGWNLLLPDQYKESDKARIIDSYYSFFLLKPSTEIIRVGNYLDPQSIQDEFDHLQNWYEKDGLPERVIQKIIISKGLLR